MLTINQEEFLANLKVTQEYCARQTRQAWQSKWLVLRSSLRPFYKNQQWFVTMPDTTGGEASAVEIAQWFRDTDPYHLKQFAELFASQLAYKKQAVSAGKPQTSYPGRIVVVDYGMNIPDGGVEVETGSSFDELDLPPIDTWFYNTCDKQGAQVLFAWIPAQFLGLVQTAIDMQFLSILH